MNARPGHPRTYRPTISPRVLEIAELLSLDYGREQIAAEIGCSFHTVSTHLRRGMAATGTHTAAAFVAYCLREGWIQ